MSCVIREPLYVMMARRHLHDAHHARSTAASSGTVPAPPPRARGPPAGPSDSAACPGSAPAQSPRLPCLPTAPAVSKSCVTHAGSARIIAANRAVLALTRALRQRTARIYAGWPTRHQFACASVKCKRTWATAVSQHEVLRTAFLTGTSAGCSLYSASSGLTRSPGARRCSRIVLISSSSSAYSSPRCARLSARARQHSFLCASKASKCVLAAASRPSRFVAAGAKKCQSLRYAVADSTTGARTHLDLDGATHPRQLQHRDFT